MELATIDNVQFGVQFNEDATALAIMAEAVNPEDNSGLLQFLVALNKLAKKLPMDSLREISERKSERSEREIEFKNELKGLLGEIGQVVEVITTKGKGTDKSKMN